MIEFVQKKRGVYANLCNAKEEKLEAYYIQRGSDGDLHLIKWKGP